MSDPDIERYIDDDDLDKFIAERMKDPVFRKEYERAQKVTTDTKHSVCPVSRCPYGVTSWHAWDCNACRQGCSSDNPCACCEDAWTQEL